MRDSLIPLLFVVLATAMAIADRAADEATWDGLRIREVRALALTTPLVQKGQATAAIVPGDGPLWATAARELQAAVAQATGVTLPVLEASAVDDAAWARQPLIVVGNLLSNPAFARLYHNFFVCADARYTGTGGYELRTVSDPWGQGHNVIALGAQAAEGLTAGVAALTQQIAAVGRPGELTLPWLRDLQLERVGRLVPVETLDAAGVEDQKATIARYYDRPGTERGAAHATIKAGMKAHRTGDPGWLEVYRYGMERIREYYRTNDYIVSQGPRRYDRDFRDSWSYGMVIAWDLLEEWPVWSDAERLDITNFALRTVFECNLYQGWDTPARLAAWQAFDSITHNHHTWPGLANLFGGWYFSRHYQLPVANDWLEIALGMYRSISRSPKPWEDSAGYQWIPLGHVLTYALATGDHTYIDDGHALDSGRSALMMLNSVGDSPGFGDTGGIGADGGITRLLPRLAYVTGDGRFVWAQEWLDRIGVRGEMDEAYWADVKPVAPDDQVGITADYLPKMHYDLLGTAKDYFEAPSLPWKETFSKLVFRQSWDANADYLMLDGYAGGSHGHLDANAICDYTALGRHWLVDGEYIRRLPKYHCSLTVLRDGLGVTLPMNTRLDEACWYGSGGLSRTTMPGYNGLTWERNIVLRPGGYGVVIDRLTAETPGLYGLLGTWRVLGPSSLEGDRLTVRQAGAGVTLVNLTGEAQEIAQTRELNGLPVYQLSQRREVQLAAGESIYLINAFAAAEPDPPALEARRVADGQVALRHEGQWELVGVDGLDRGGYATDAAVYRVSAQDVWLAGASRWQSPGGEWSAATPASVLLSGDAVAAAQPGYLPEPGFRPAWRIGAERTATRLALGPLPDALTAAVAPAPEAAPAGLAGVAQSPAVWHFADFPAAPQAVPGVGIRSTLEPLAKYRPLERLITGRYTSSVGSCQFPAGQPVEITVDLGSAQTLSEVRVRAWEMQASWRATNYRVSLSNDDFATDIRPLEGPLEQVGTERWGNNINTIYGLRFPPAQARQVRFSAEPAAPENTIYWAELECFGSAMTARADLTCAAAVDLDGDGVAETVVGTAGGEIVAISATGTKLWEAKVDGAVTALAGGQLGGGPRVVYGTSNAVLGVIGPEGAELGQVEVPTYRGIPSRPRTILLADLLATGENAILVGVDSWQYLSYSADLALHWKTVIYAHAATVGAVGNLDGTGRLKLVAGNVYYRLQLINSDGSDGRAFDRFGPEQTAVATGDLDGDGKDEIAIGTDDGQLLVFTGQGRRLWDRPLGDRLTSLAVTAGRVTAASASGYVWQFEPDGTVRWQTSLGSPVRRLLQRTEGWLAVTARSGAVQLDAAGQPQEVTPLPAPALDGVAAGPGAAVLLADGAVVGVPWR